MSLVFFIFGLLLIFVSLYYWLFVHEKGESDSLMVADAQQEKMDTEAGRIESSLIAGKIQSQTNLQLTINESKRAVVETIQMESLIVATQLDKETIPEHHKETRQKEKAAHLVYLSQQDTALVDERTAQVSQFARQDLITEAVKSKLTIENHQQVQLSQKLSDIKVSEHRQLEEINLNNNLAEIQERVRLAIIAKFLSNEQIVTEIQTQIDNVYKQIDEINTKNEFSPEIQKRMIEDREEIIAAFKAKRNERQAGLLEVNNRGNLRGDDLDAEL